MQGKSDPNAQLLDAAALCAHLVPAGSVHAFLAEHRQALFPDEYFADLLPSGRADRRCPPTFRRVRRLVSRQLSTRIIVFFTAAGVRKSEPLPPVATRATLHSWEGI